MRAPSVLVLIASLLSADVAFAQKEVVFGTSNPPVFRAEAHDQRFRRTRLSQALRSGEVGPECVQLVGGMLTAVAETGMQFHKRDETLFLPQALSQAVDTQLSGPNFNGRAYYLSLVREVLIGGRVPASWLKVAQAIAPSYPALDLGKLSFLSSKRIEPIDSFHFTLQTLRNQHELEVKRATSVNASSAFANFKDDYTDRTVAWGDLVLTDLKLEKPKGKGGFESYEPPAQIAILRVNAPPKQSDDFTAMMPFAGKKKKEKVLEITARLTEDQYIPLDRLPKGTRVMVRGRVWDFDKDVTKVQLRDARIFLDPDWNRGATLALPGAIEGCPLAVNDLTGLANQQPSGFGH